MSLTSFVKIPEVRERLTPFRPAFPRTLRVETRVATSGSRPSMIGTAFDYLLRFELKRRVPKALTAPWAAESSVQSMDMQVKCGGRLDGSIPPPDSHLSEDVEDRKVVESARMVVIRAKHDLKRYSKLVKPIKSHRIQMASHAIRLAKLDPYYRALVLDNSFETADPFDVEVLLSLLALVPFGDILSHRAVLLNPVFNDVSNLVGGADCDLIVGDVLVDVKTVKECVVDSEILDQLLGYFLLARRQRVIDGRFPVVNRLAVYFSRQAHLWSLPVTSWTSFQGFAEMENWFLVYAKDARGRARRILVD